MTHPALLLIAALLTSSAAAAPPAPQGHWAFVDDGTVIEFVPCGEALCAQVRGLPPVVEKGDVPPACGQTVLTGLRPEAGQWRGEVIDPETRRRFRVRLEPQGDGWRLVVSVLTFTETLQLRPAGEFKRCG